MKKSTITEGQIRLGGLKPVKHSKRPPAPGGSASGCTCTFAQMTVGDGCRFCNPELHVELTEDC